ncbi:MAG: type II toxin-antitoxin system RelE/ParE family toxin [Flavobacteriales bacterium]|nr:type II toxin-antitoxin system RelE/ParE family toxin [Flavobacteriales bacterium]
MFEIKQTDEFQHWMKKLRDIRVNTLIVKRLERIALGNFGDHKRIDSKISELRIDYGPGYRLYYMNNGKEIILLLIGGDKSSQKSDIQRAKELASEMGGKHD